MGQAACDWKSFWSIATPEDTAHTLSEWYGQEAAQLAAECGLAARGGDRDEDYRFCFAVFARLRMREPRPAAAALALLPE